MGTAQDIGIWLAACCDWLAADVVWAVGVGGGRNSGRGSEGMRGSRIQFSIIHMDGSGNASLEYDTWNWLGICDDIRAHPFRVKFSYKVIRGSRPSYNDRVTRHEGVFIMGEGSIVEGLENIVVGFKRTVEVRKLEMGGRG